MQKGTCPLGNIIKVGTTLLRNSLYTWRNNFNFPRKDNNTPVGIHSNFFAENLLV